MFGDGNFMEVIRVFIDEILDRSLLFTVMWGHSRKVAIWKQKESPHKKPNWLAGTSMLDFYPSELWQSRLWVRGCSHHIICDNLLWQHNLTRQPSSSHPQLPTCGARSRQEASCLCLSFFAATRIFQSKTATHPLLS